MFTFYLSKGILNQIMLDSYVRERRLELHALFSLQKYCLFMRRFSFDYEYVVAS